MNFKSYTIGGRHLIYGITQTEWDRDFERLRACVHLILQAAPATGAVSRFFAPLGVNGRADNARIQSLRWTVEVSRNIFCVFRFLLVDALEPAYACTQR